MKDQARTENPSDTTFLNILNGLDVQLLVTELGTDKVLFSNEKMNSNYNISTSSLGKPCWEVYQSGRAERCDFCRISEVERNGGQPIEWVAFHPDTQRWFRNTDSIIEWTDGRMVHLQQGVDITEIKSAETQLGRRLTQQELTCSMLQGFISTRDTRQIIGESLQMIGEFLSVDRVALARIDDRNTELSLETAWLAEGAEARVRTAPAPFGLERMRRYFLSERLPHVADSDIGARENGPAAHLSVPIFVDGMLWGILSMEVYLGSRAWSSNDVLLGRITGNVIGGVLTGEKIQGDLRESDLRVRTMLDACPVACILYDEEYRVVDCNEEALRMCGFADKDRFLASFKQMNADYQPDGLKSDDAEAVRIREAIRDGRAQFEWLQVLDNGEELPLRVTLERVPWMDGYRIVGYAWELRQERARAAAMREAEERTQMMLDATPLACTFFAEDYSLVDCNLEAVRMFGRADKVDYIRNFDDISPPVQPDGLESGRKARMMLERAFASGREAFEWMHRHADGTLIPVEITLVRVKWRDGYRLAGYARDLRELKAKMEEVERTQAELRRERDRAEASARSKTNFLANMSHEIRTPMNAIIGMTNIAKSSGDLERIRYCVDKVDDAANHLLGVINDILDMSKIEAGRLDLSQSDFLLEKMLQRVSNVTNFRTDQKRQDFIIKVDKDVPPAIVTDQQRLTQVITNLLSNAVKFTPDGGKIRLLVHMVEDAGHMCTLLFEVIDTGIGISQEQQSKLWQSFEQADGSISRRFGGTGLGLAITKSLVERMGGSVGIDSEPQKGSRFYFTARVRKGQANYDNRLNPNVDWKNVRILVVDDAPEVCDYFEDIMGSIGLTCNTAPDGYEACRMLEADASYNIIFVDWMMPGMDGIELTGAIRRKYGGNVVVIMISAVDWEQIKESAQSAGVDRFVAKPLLPSPIIDCINECLGQRSEVQERARAVQENGVFAGKRILLAEDIEINREIIVTLLEDTGVEIDSACDGVEVCEMLAKDSERYDLILMDIHMPDMDGFLATKKIRSMGTEKSLSIPIVAMTANVFREDVERCLAVGMDDHVGKPVDIDELMNKLKRYL